LTQQPVADFGDALQITFALFRLLFKLELLDFFFQFSGTGDEIFFFFPIGLEALDFSRIPANSFSMTARRSLELVSSSFFSACFSFQAAWPGGSS